MVGPPTTISGLGLEMKKPDNLKNWMVRRGSMIGMEVSPVAVGLVERWNPRTHNLSTPNQREWVKFVLLTLVKRLRLPYFVAVIVLQSMKRSELGDGRPIAL